MDNGTSNVFITQTKNPFLPYIQAFTDYMSKYMEQQGVLAEKMYAFSKKKQADAFMGEFGKKLINSKNYTELSSNLSAAYVQASEKGFTELLPTLGSIAEIQTKGLDISEAGKQVETLKRTYSNAMTVLDGKVMPFSQAISILEKTSKDPLSLKANVEILSQNILKQSKDIVPVGKDYAYAVGYEDATGKSYNVEQYPIVESKEEGKVYADTDKEKGLSAEDTLLDPALAKVYGSYKKQDKYLQSLESRSGTGRDFKVSDPRYVWTNPQGEEIDVFWDPNKRQYINPDNNESVTGKVVPYTSSNKYREQGQMNLGIITEMRNFAKNMGKEEALTELNAMPYTYGVGYYKDLPTETLEDFGRLLASEIGDNWDNPTNPELIKLKKKFPKTMSTGNPYLLKWGQIMSGGNLPTVIDTSYANQMTE